jgi:hypothetical protein
MKEGIRIDLIGTDYSKLTLLEKNHTGESAVIQVPQKDRGDAPFKIPWKKRTGSNGYVNEVGGARTFLGRYRMLHWLLFRAFEV